MGNERQARQASSISQPSPRGEAGLLNSASSAETRSGLLTRPLDALVFLLPLIAFYQVSALTGASAERLGPDQVIAFHLIRRFLELFGHAGVWAPGVAVVVILLATHMVSGEAWSVRWPRVGWMYVEAAVLAVPLLALNWWITTPSALDAPIQGVAIAQSGLALPMVSSGAGRLLYDRIALGIGAGVYEELVFRLGLICLVLIVGVDLLRLSRPSVGAAAIVLSSLAFAAHHHRPIGAEPFELMAFVFRTVAGVYLAAVFWYRGYGPAAGCHAAYNVVLACTNTGGA